MQTTDTVMMVRPAHFGFNPQTASTNAFQNPRAATKLSESVHLLALQEFDGMVDMLKQNGVNVIVVYDTPEPVKPDAIFPNNWISFHEDGTVVFYPMQAENRRWERRRSILGLLRDDFDIRQEIDLSHYEADDKFLEGTGSMILDYDHKICYACFSPRTDADVLADFAKKMGFHVVSFHAKDENGKDIYHTNVMMCVATHYVIICIEAIPQEEREKVIRAITNSGKEIIEISFSQMNQFAGNMLEVHNNKGEKLLVMSDQAYRSLTTHQLERIGRYARPIFAPLYTIEANGGGSARCMMAAVHLPKKANLQSVN
ncbi:MAG: arginine deiminase-related protein [Cytophagales bacterium]|nr:arginine deiminase-related protein [Bernardetiaceae bacterium]MDW8203449.1 arginine deiminase-related protein [Cytophagales bacterium]